MLVGITFCQFMVRVRYHIIGIFKPVLGERMMLVGMLWCGSDTIS